MVEAEEKHQLPEAPISITVMAYWKGFQVLITRRTGEQPIISQVPGIISLVDKLIEEGFEPVREMPQLILPTTETKDSGKEISAPICQIHNVSMIKKGSTSRPKDLTRFGRAQLEMQMGRSVNINLKSKYNSP